MRRQSATGGRLGTISSTLLGVGSAAPAYSLAASLPVLVAAAGEHSVGVILVVCLPILALAVAYSRLNRAHPDCGTSFAWTSREMGPTLGLLSGWASLAADVLVMASLGGVAASMTLRLVGARDSRMAVVGVGVVWLLVVTLWSVGGIRRAVAVQRIVVLIEIGFLAAIAMALLTNGAGASAPTAAWLSPFGSGAVDLHQAAAVAIFLFWGWETSLSVNEEMREPRRAPGRAGLAAAGILAAIYSFVTLAVVSTPHVANAVVGGDPLNGLVDQLGGAALGGLLAAVVLLSALSSAQGTVLPSVRTSVSMARRGVLDPRLATPNLNSQPPIAATLLVEQVSVIWFGLLASLGQNVLEASLGPLSVLISFYYCLTGIACVRAHLSPERGSTMAAIGGRSRWAVLIASGASAVAFAYFLADSIRTLVAAAVAGPAGVESLAPVVFGVALAASGLGLLVRERRRTPARLATPP